MIVRSVVLYHNPSREQGIPGWPPASFPECYGPGPRGGSHRKSRDYPTAPDESDLPRIEAFHGDRSTRKSVIFKTMSARRVLARSAGRMRKPSEGMGAFGRLVEPETEGKVSGSRRRLRQRVLHRSARRSMTPWSGAALPAVLSRRVPSMASFIPSRCGSPSRQPRRTSRKAP